MRNVWADSESSMAGSPAKKRDTWREKTSDHVAWSLLVFTGILIFLTTPEMKKGFDSILPYLLLAVIVGLFIPILQWFERRWNARDHESTSDPALRSAFVRDMIGLWLLTAGIPLLLALGFSVIYGG